MIWGWWGKRFRVRSWHSTKGVIVFRCTPPVDYATAMEMYTAGCARARLLGDEVDVELQQLSWWLSAWVPIAEFSTTLRGNKGRLA